MQHAVDNADNNADDFNVFFLGFRAKKQGQNMTMTIVHAQHASSCAVHTLHTTTSPTWQLRWFKHRLMHARSRLIVVYVSEEKNGGTNVGGVRVNEQQRCNTYVVTKADKKADDFNAFEVSKRKSEDKKT